MNGFEIVKNRIRMCRFVVSNLEAQLRNGHEAYDRGLHQALVSLGGDCYNRDDYEVTKVGFSRNEDSMEFRVTDKPLLKRLAETFTMYGLTIRDHTDLFPFEEEQDDLWEEYDEALCNN